MSVLGIDIGSRAVKLVLMENNNIMRTDTYDTYDFYTKYCENIDRKIRLDLDKLEIENVKHFVSTGYGRNNVNIKDADVILELKAHVFGALWQTGIDSFTLLDVGGQDSKVISVNNKKIKDMVLNDKCAASCGRYLENMAKIIGLEISQMENHFENPVELSSTCAVFAESELIGKISEGFSVGALAAGINYSLYKRIKPLVERFPSDTLVVTGGVAMNKAFIKLLKENMVFNEIIVPKNPQLNGAIGCCAYKESVR